MDTVPTVLLPVLAMMAHNLGFTYLDGNDSNRATHIEVRDECVYGGQQYVSMEGNSTSDGFPTTPGGLQQSPDGIAVGILDDLGMEMQVTTKILYQCLACGDAPRVRPTFLRLAAEQGFLRPTIARALPGAHRKGQRGCHREIEC